jgi:hypothetical protein
VSLEFGYKRIQFLRMEGSSLELTVETSAKVIYDITALMKERKEAVVVGQVLGDKSKCTGSGYSVKLTVGFLLCISH